MLAGSATTERMGDNQGQPGYKQKGTFVQMRMQPFYIDTSENSTVIPPQLNKGHHHLQQSPVLSERVDASVPCVYSSTEPSFQETELSCFHREMNNNTTQLSKRGILATCDNRGDSRGHCVKCNEPGTRRTTNMAELRPIWDLRSHRSRVEL